MKKSLIDLYDKYLQEGQDEFSMSKQERSAFVQKVEQYGQYGAALNRRSSLKDVSKQIGELIEIAKHINLKETEDGWFDDMIVKRSNKQLDDAYKVFEKTCNEITVLEQRAKALYQEIGSILSTYYKV